MALGGPQARMKMWNAWGVASISSQLPIATRDFNPVFRVAGRQNIAAGIGGPSCSQCSIVVAQYMESGPNGPP